MYKSLAYIAYRQTSNLEDAWQRYIVITRFAPACKCEDFLQWYKKNQQKEAEIVEE